MINPSNEQYKWVQSTVTAVSVRTNYE